MKTASRSALTAAMMLFGMVFAFAGSAQAHVAQAVAGDPTVLSMPTVMQPAMRPLEVASDASRPNNRPNFNRPNFNRPNFNRPFFNRPFFNRPFFNRPDFNRPNIDRFDFDPFFRPFFFEEGFAD